MKILIVVLTVNNYSDTRECIDSLLSLDFDNYDILVVDNGSTDESINLLRKDYPNLSYICIKKNCGFAGGMNKGLEYAVEEKADYVWLLNNDITVEKNSLSNLVEIASNISKVGMIGSKVYYYSSPNKINFAGGKVSKITGRTLHRGTGLIDDGRFNDLEEVDFLTGASLFINMNMIKEIGFFDESYFLFYEDADLVMRARDAGWKTIFAPNSIIWHKISQTTESSGFSNTYYGVRNSLYFCKEHIPYCLPFSMVSNFWRYIIINTIKFFVKGLSRKELENVRMALKGFADFFRNNMGRCEYDNRWACLE